MTPLPTPFSFGKSYLTLGLDADLFSKLPETVTIFENMLFRKEKFHVSLLCLKAMVPMIGTRIDFSDQDIEKILTLFGEYSNGHQVELTDFTNELRYVTKDERKCVVVKVHVSNMEDFILTCEREFNIQIPPPPFHVTLYTLPKDSGVGINTYEAWNDLSQVELPEVSNALLKLAEK